MPDSTEFSEVREQDILKEVPFNEWSDLSDLYKNNWPYGIYAHYVLRNFIAWKSKESNFPVQIYSPNGDWSDGTFIIKAYLGGSTIHLFTLDPTSGALTEALVKTRLLDWSQNPMLCGVHDNHRDCVYRLQDSQKVKIKFELPSGYHWMSAEKAKNLDIECPPDVYIQPLKVEDVEVIDSLWPHRYPGSESFLRDLVRFNGGIGLFEKGTNNICSWIMKNQFLGLGMLQTLPKYQGKGYAKLVTKALTKSMAEEGLDVHTCILRTNAQSLKLFKNIGFEFIDGLAWIQMEGCNSNILS